MIETKDAFAHRIRIAQLVERNQNQLAEEYTAAMHSTELLAIFFERLEKKVKQIMDLVLLTPEEARMYSLLILSKDLTLDKSGSPAFDDAFLDAAARVFIVGFYQKMKSTVQSELRQYPFLVTVYERGKKRL